LDMMRMLLKLLLINNILCLCLLVSSAMAQSDLTYDRDEPPDTEMLMTVHERFVYNVRYGFLNLGEVEVELLQDTTYEGKNVLYMRTIMRSNSRIPFVGTRNVHYQNFFNYNEDWFYSHKFWRDDLHDEDYERYKIEFDREKQEVRFFEQGEAMDTLDLEEPASGGDIIFYFGRLFAGTDESYELPVYIDNEKGYVTADNSPETEERSYDAFSAPIQTYMSEGNADIDGPFGFRGRFRAWFATDDLRVPVEAHVRIIFGNVKIRLISYERLNERTASELSTAGTRRGY
jgi:hypothetical protein